MPRFKYYRYAMNGTTEKALPVKGLIRIVDGTAVYDRPLTSKEIKKAKLTENEDNDGAWEVTRLRMAKGYTQWDLAHKSGVPKNAIQRYDVYGMGTCPLKYAVKLAKALDCEVNDFLRDIAKEDDEN